MIRKIRINIFLLVPLIFVVSLLFGTMFYRIHHGWELSTSFYYSAQVLAGCMYDMPSESDPVSTSFTLIFFLFGSSVMAAAFGAFVSTLVSNSYQVASETRKTIRKQALEDLAAKSGSPRYTDIAIEDISWIKSILSYYLTNLRESIGWKLHRSKYITVCAALCWIFIGVQYGLLYEKWAFSTSLRFALRLRVGLRVRIRICT